MAQLCGFNGGSIELKVETNDTCSSNELDHVPLISRRKLLMSRKKDSCSAEDNSNLQVNVAVIKKENEQCDSQALYSFRPASHSSKETNLQSLQQQFHETSVPLEVNFVVACDKIQVDCHASDNCAQNSSPFLESFMKEDCDSHVTDANGNIYSDKSLLESSINSFIDAAVQANIADDFADDLDHIVLIERRRMLLSRKILMEKPIPEESLNELNPRDTLDIVHVRTNGMSGSTVLNLVKVKGEPLDYNEFHKPDMNPINEKIPVKSEMHTSDESDRDGEDHMQLRDRMKKQTPREDSKLNISGNFECFRKDFISSDKYGAAAVEASHPIRINRPRKRKKTATDSIETAMEEDAPGLLKVLLEQGVSVDEIKLYGEKDDDEPIDESFMEDSFTELEAVISKIFFQRNSLLKLVPLHCVKGSKPSYCLSCLFALVEQTRYLKFRKWPAEWGWSRDLQSFIFVFERHKRIVMERPEYGYATYFFELVDSLPVEWQIKRLVTTMKLTNCGRINLLENKPLVVGEDLTEGEAHVLKQYGWVPNCGIGTMLNYCDRVFHDRRNEKETSEWRSKIGKLLMDGYNGGTIVSSNIEETVLQCGAGESTQIKMEL